MTRLDDVLLGEMWGHEAPPEMSGEEAATWARGYNEAVELANARITELYQQLEDLQYALNNNGH